MVAVENSILSNLEGHERQDTGTWEIANRKDVSIRLDMHVGNATEELYLLVGHEDLLEAELIDALVDAAERDVSILAEVPSASARDRIHDRIPGAEVAVTEFSAHRAEAVEQKVGRLLTR